MGHDSLGNFLLTGGSGLIRKALRNQMQARGINWLQAIRQSAN